MDISSIISLIGQSHAGQATQTSRSKTADAVAAAFEKVNSRIEQQLGSTKVQLSAFGQIQSAFADLQTAGKALSATKETATADDIEKAAASFVDAFNKANKTVSAATQRDGKQSGALANDVRARLAETDLRRSVSTGDSLADLKKIGITQGKDGSLAVDAKKLESALQANPDEVRKALANVGEQVEKTASRELAKGGNVGSSVDALTNRSRNLETQQSEQQEQVDAAQRAVDQQTTRLNLNTTSSSGIAAYQRTFVG